MNKLAIKTLEDRISEKIGCIESYITANSNDYEHIEDMKIDVLEIRKSIAILKVFSMNDLIEDLLKNKKEN